MNEMIWVVYYQANIADFSDNHWVTCFQDSAEQILGKKSDEIGHLKDNVQVIWFTTLIAL